MGFAMACNCSTLSLFTPKESGNSPPAAEAIAPCGKCRTCRQILSGKSPDVIFLEPDGDIIKIDTVRELSRRIAYKPYQASRRVIIISDAQTLNREAANALLKSLEEPPPRTVFFLTAGQPSDLLPTVVSRCQSIRFNPVSAAGIEKMLRDQRGVTRSSAKTAALLADGSMARALELVNDSCGATSAAVRREWIIAELERLPGRPLPTVLAFAEKLAADKKNLLSALHLIKDYLRDVLICRYCPEKIINTDMKARIHTAAAQNAAVSLVLKIDAVSNTERALARKANPRLWLESLSLTLAGFTHEKNC